MSGFQRLEAGLALAMLVSRLETQTSMLERLKKDEKNYRVLTKQITKYKRETSLATPSFGAF